MVARGPHSHVDEKNEAIQRYDAPGLHGLVQVQSDQARRIGSAQENVGPADPVQGYSYP